MNEIREYIEVEKTEEIEKFCENKLVIPNPEHSKRLRLGIWIGNTPIELKLYEVIGDKIRIPYGFLYKIKDFLKDFKDHTKCKYPINIHGDIELYDYQKKVLDSIDKRCGIIQAPAGSGKTQIGIALIKKLGYRALWLTHTTDLLNQSKKRYQSYFGKNGVGTITNGKVNIGNKVTFATVQTMAKLDLSKYKDIFDVIIVDECHNVVGSPTKVQRFYKVLNNLNARYKYGLTATLHRSDGLVKATKAIIGDVVIKIDEDDVKDKILNVGIKAINTGVKDDICYLKYDGTIDWQKLVNYLCDNNKRNHIIMQKLKENKEHSNLILSDRINHLLELKKLYPRNYKKRQLYYLLSLKNQLEKKPLMI